MKSEDPVNDPWKMKSPRAAKNIMNAKMETKIRIESLKSSRISIRLVRIELKNNMTIIGLSELLT